MFPYKRILVTGGLGFIGTYVIEQLLANPTIEQVINVDKLTYAAYQPILPDWKADPCFSHYTQDICDRNGLIKIFDAHKPDCILHLAAESHVDNSISNGLPFIRTNVEGTYTLCQTATHYQVKRFVHVSTDEVFGSLSMDDKPFGDNDQYLPNSPYSASKAASDHIVRAFVQTHGLPALMTHCGNNYGPRQHGEKLIPTVIRSIVNDQPIPIYGTGKNVRDWIHARDHAAALLFLAVHGQVGAQYNIGAEQEMSNLELVNEIISQMRDSHPGAEELITFVADRPGHDWRYALNTQKLKTLGYRPKTILSQGLKETVNWYTKALAVA